ncbi:MAG: hypothetical protein ACREIR_11240 [Geminicoccaceae bacterium]
MALSGNQVIPGFAVIRVFGFSGDPSSLQVVSIFEDFVDAPFVVIIH